MCQCHTQKVDYYQIGLLADQTDLTLTWRNEFQRTPKSREMIVLPYLRLQTNNILTQNHQFT
jgi:hypothetical protein